MLLDERRPGSRFVICILVILSLFFIFGVISVSPVFSIPTRNRAAVNEAEHQSIPYVTAQVGPHWHGWEHISQIFALGDSYSSIEFNISAPAPNEDLPLGQDPSEISTVANGFNWIEYLTYTYNESRIVTVDLAKGGATIDADLIRPEAAIRTWLQGLRTQVEQVWETHSWDWTSDTALFAIWFGVNDITSVTNATRGNYHQEMVEYADLIDQLYQRGAKNFLLLNVPPMDLAPIRYIWQPDWTRDWPELVDQWNVNVTKMTQNFSRTYSDATMVHMDVWKVFDDAITNPCTFEETCGIISTTASCKWYAYGTQTPDFKHPDCPFSVDKYLWYHPFHPGTQMHNATARVAYNALKAIKPLQD